MALALFKGKVVRIPVVKQVGVEADQDEVCDLLHQLSVQILVPLHLFFLSALFAGASNLALAVAAVMELPWLNMRNDVGLSLDFVLLDSTTFSKDWMTVEIDGYSFLKLVQCILEAAVILILLGKHAIQERSEVLNDADREVLDLNKMQLFLLKVDRAHSLIALLLLFRGLVQQCYILILGKAKLHRLLCRVLRVMG